MDFGSFLRQRRQKQLGGTGDDSRESWALDKPLMDVGRDEGRINDSAYYDGSSESWNQPDMYHQDAEFVGQGPAVGPYGEPSGSRGRGFRGRGRGPASFGRGRGTYTPEFGRGMRPGMEEFPPWGPDASFGQPSGYGDESEYFQDSSAIRDGYDRGMETPGSKGHDASMPAEHSRNSQGSDANNLKNEGMSGNSKSDENVETKKKRDKETIVKTDEEIKALEEFDLMQVNINWEHFSVTKRMLMEACSVGKQPISMKKNYDVTRLEFYCKLCDIQTVSAGNLYSHLVGKKHKMKAEQEIEAADTHMESDSKDEAAIGSSTYGGTIGFELKDDDKDKEDEDGDDKNKDEKDTTYEKTYYADFKRSEVNVDWEFAEITQSMLKEADFETRVPKFEDRCFDIFNLQFYCRLCDIQSTSTATFHDHLSGRKHKNKVLKFVNTPEVNEDIEEGAANDDYELTEHEKHVLQEFDIFHVSINWDHYNITKEMLLEANTEGVPGLSQRKKKKKEVDLNRLEFYCKLCASQMVSAGNFHDHLVGRKHKQAYQEHVKGIPYDHTALKPEEIGQKSVFENLLKDVSKPILGLSHITEMHSNFDIWCICGLCGCKFRSRMAVNHVLGVKHRLLYMRKHHSDVYQDLKALHEKNTPFYCELAQEGRTKEASDGRGKSLVKHFEKERDAEGDEKRGKCVQDFVEWFSAEHDVCKVEFQQEFKGRPMSPILVRNKVEKNDDKAVDDKPQEHGNSQNEFNASRDGQSPPPRRNARGRGQHPFGFGDEPPYPPHLPPPWEMAYGGDPMMRFRGMPRDEFMDRRRYPDRDPLLRDRFMDRERDPLLRERFMDRDPLLRERFMDRERDPMLRDRFMDRERDLLRERDPLMRDRDVDRGPLYRERLPDSYRDTDPRKSRPRAQSPYLDPDPLKRIRKPDPHPGPNPPKQTLKSEPYIDPDPLKRILPSQKVKAKPVVIDYGHGKEEKSEKSKAKEWEDDINDILDSGRESKGPDSLALLSSSYSSPKREKTPPRIVRTKPLPFEKSYLDRAKDSDLVSKNQRSRKGGRDSPPPKRRHTRSPEYAARNPDHPLARRGRDRKQPRYSPPKGNRWSHKTYSPHKSNRAAEFDRISISSESPSRDSPVGPSKLVSTKNPHRFVKSPKLKKRGRSPHSRSRSSSSSSSSSRSSHDSPSRPGKYMRRKGPSGPASKSKPAPNSLKYSSRSGPSHAHHGPPPSSSSIRSKKSRSKSPSRRLPKPLSGPASKSRRSRSPFEIFPKSLPPSLNRSLLPESAPPPPLPTSLPPTPPLPKTRSPVSRRPRSKSPGPPPAELPPRPPQSPPRKLSRSRSPSGPLPRSLPPTPPPKSSRHRSPSPRRQSKNPPPVDSSDEDAQAERIAIMLLNMKGSIVGSEMDDPHAALQALLSSKELTEALLATRTESPEHGASASAFERRSSPPMATTSSREKITFSFAGAGRGMVPSRNVPQTFMEEESSDENN